MAQAESCRSKLRVAYLLLVLIATVNGQPQRETNFVKYHKSPKVRVISKLVYAKYGARQLYLDLYLPLPLEQNRPGAVVVRGGGWLVGDRKGFAHVASALAERGVAAACIEYRTADKDAFPAAIQDVKAAVRWMRANASKYGIDPEVVGTIGGSSGAHMALLVGLTQGIPEFEGNGRNVGTSSAVQGVVAMAVPTDLLTLTERNKEAVGKFLHAMPEQDEQKWRLASPVHHIRRDGPPVLLLHGANDDSVPTTQATDFAQRYRDAGASADVCILDGAPHAFWNYYPWFTEAMQRAASFFVQLENKKQPVLTSSPETNQGQNRASFHRKLLKWAAFLLRYIDERGHVQNRKNCPGTLFQGRSSRMRKALFRRRILPQVERLQPEIVNSAGCPDTHSKWSWIPRFRA